MLKAAEALERLREGNQRFVNGMQRNESFASATQGKDLTTSQTPFAVILGCSDSRVPAEIVFDQSLGDLFVIRVAGNIVAPSGIGSVEFAVEQFGVPLVIVLGHSQCGAVIATLADLTQPVPGQSSNVLSIVNRIRPSIGPLFATELRNDPEQLLDTAIRANIMASTNQLRHGSQLLEQLIQQDKLSIVGAEYSLETGVVEFFENV